MPTSVAEMDKEWYAKRDPKTEEPTKIAKIYVTVYYAEKGEQMLHHFKKSIPNTIPSCKRKRTRYPMMGW